MDFEKFITGFPANPFKKYSQTGEEGILQYIFDQIGTTNKFLVDLGAGDGKRLSNTNLFIEQGWNGCRLDQNGTNDVHSARITRENICALLHQYNVPETFDLLSMDLDGNDFWVLAEVITNFKPLVIVCEVNGMFAPGVSKSIAYNPDHNHADNDYYGASHEAFNRLLHDYVCVYNRHSLNLFYVHRDVVGEVDYSAEQVAKAYHHHLPNGNWVDNPETQVEVARKAPEPANKPQPQPEPIAPKATDQKPAPELSGNSEQLEPEVSATPAAAKLAKANKIDLSKVTGTGKDGKITKGDVEALIEG